MTPRDRLARPPSDRAYSIAGWCLLVVAAILIGYLFGAARFFPTTRAVAVRAVVTLVLVFNLIWWRIADRRLARYVVRPRISACLRVAVAAFIIAINIPVVQMLVAGRMPEYVNHIPTLLTAAFAVWQLGSASCCRWSPCCVSLGWAFARRRGPSPGDGPQRWNRPPTPPADASS